MRASTNLLRILLTALLLLATSAARAEPGDEYAISVLTMSPGDPLFFRFGHNAILVRNARTGSDAVYNWGTFSFEEPGLVTKFLKGRLSYWLSVQSLEGTIDHYRSENRWLYEQELNLTAAQKKKLVAMVTMNARPENRYYRYHYYRDNCSTRVRDVVDTVTDGSLKAVSSGPSPWTFRGETSRLTADVWWGYVFLNLAMGDYIDQPITQWEQMFVPERVMETLRRAKNKDALGVDVPLVRSEKWLVQADRPPAWEQPPRRTLPLLLTGAIVGGLLGWSAWRWLRATRPGAKSPLGIRLAFALPGIAIGGFSGFLGLLFLFFWVATDHQVAWRNENLLQTSPLSIALVVVAAGVLRDRSWARKAVSVVSYALAAMSLVGLALKVLPWFDQVNGEMIALVLPIWAGLAAGSFVGTRKAVVTPADAKAGATAG